MNSQEFENRILEYKKEFESFITKVSNDVIEFKQINPNKTMYGLVNTDNFCDNIMQSGGWIKDKINGTLANEKPKKSLVVKLRKVLGFTYA